MGGERTTGPRPPLIAPARTIPAPRSGGALQLGFFLAVDDEHRTKAKDLVVPGSRFTYPSAPDSKPLPLTGEAVMKIRARNVLKGKVVEVEKGQTTAHVRIDIGNGKVVTASITNQAVDDLGLKSGQEAYAIVKASDVMVAVD